MIKVPEVPEEKKPFNDCVKVQGKRLWFVIKFDV